MSCDCVVEGTYSSWVLFASVFGMSEVDTLAWRLVSLAGVLEAFTVSKDKC